jgi:hypothetical protein
MQGRITSLNLGTAIDSPNVKKATDAKAPFSEALYGSEEGFAAYVQQAMSPDNRSPVFENLVQLAQFGARTVANPALSEQLRTALDLAAKRELVNADDATVAGIRDGAKRLSETPYFEKIGRSLLQRIGGGDPIPVARRPGGIHLIQPAR